MVNMDAMMVPPVRIERTLHEVEHDFESGDGYRNHLIFLHFSGPASLVCKKLCKFDPKIAGKRPVDI